MATGPELRIGDAEREATADSLREHYAQGRLSLDEFNERLSATFSAVTQRDLDELTADLPHVRTPLAPLPQQSAGPGTGPRRGGIGAFASLIAALAVVAVFSFAVAPGMWHHRFFSLPGRLPFLIIGLLILRTLFRRLFGSRMGGGRSGSCRSGRRW
jgi:uncharacterized membrane protein